MICSRPMPVRESARWSIGSRSATVRRALAPDDSRGRPDGSRRTTIVAQSSAAVCLLEGCSIFFLEEQSFDHRPRADENCCANQRSCQRKISVIAGTVDDHLTKSGRPQLVDAPLGCGNLPQHKQPDEPPRQDAGTLLSGRRIFAGRSWSLRFMGGRSVALAAAVASQSDQRY